MYNILVQGPLNAISIDNLNEYKKYGKVVVSCWKDEKKTPLLKQLWSIPDITVVFTDEPAGVKHPDRSSKETTFFKAITSQFFGLTACTQPFTIKTRSDECFNLEPLIKRFEDGNQHKIIFGNIFYTRDMYHIGDHLFVAKTDMLYRSVKKIYRYYHGLEEDDFCDKYLREKYRVVLAEHVLCHSILRHMGVEEVRNLQTTYKFIQENFIVMDINELVPFVAKYAGASRTFKNKFEERIAITDIKQVNTP